MKQIIFLVCLMLGLSTTYAQTFNTKALPTNKLRVDATGEFQGFNYLTGNICTIVTGTVTAMPSTRAADTLVVPATGITGYATDTGYVQFTLNSNFDLLFDFSVVKISGTVAGTGLLQGSTDNATWHTITGNTTYCADCQGASATITNGSAHYQWYVPHSATNYPYYQIRAITTGTSSATFSGKVAYKY